MIAHEDARPVYCLYIWNEEFPMDRPYIRVCPKCGHKMLVGLWVHGVYYQELKERVSDKLWELEEELGRELTDEEIESVQKRYSPTMEEELEAEIKDIEFLEYLNKVDPLED
jgi:hypothetical protein